MIKIFGRIKNSLRIRPAIVASGLEAAEKNDVWRSVPPGFARGGAPPAVKQSTITGWIRSQSKYRVEPMHRALQTHCSPDRAAGPAPYAHLMRCAGELPRDWRAASGGRPHCAPPQLGCHGRAPCTFDFHLPRRLRATRPQLTVKPSPIVLASNSRNHQAHPTPSPPKSSSIAWHLVPHPPIFLQPHCQTHACPSLGLAIALAHCPSHTLARLP